jgi:ribose/xylose/arabinose/galactoside ABC-type transport system permease subunit
MRKKYKEFILIIVFVSIFVTIGIVRPEEFLKIQNLQSMAFQLAEFGIICLGMMIVMTTGRIDLSIISITTFSGIMGAFILSSDIESIELKILLAIVLTMIVAFICGLINGIIVSYIGVSSMIATLGTMILFKGISLNLTKGGAISGFPKAYHWIGNSNIGGIPIPMIIFGLIAFITAYMLGRTKWGRQVILVGIDPVAARYSGIHVEKVVLYAYIYSALLAGTAVIVMNARYNSIRVDYGWSYLLKSIVAVVLANSSGVNDGYRKVIGVFLAASILQVLSSGFNILGLSQSLVDLALGLILIIVLTVDYFISNYPNLQKKVLNTNVFIKTK